MLVSAPQETDNKATFEHSYEGRSGLQGLIVAPKPTANNSGALETRGKPLRD